MAGAALVERRVALDVGDDEEIHVAAVMRRALGVGAEQDDALRGEGTDQALDSPLDERRKVGRHESVHLLAHRVIH